MSPGPDRTCRGIARRAAAAAPALALALAARPAPAAGGPSAPAADVSPTPPAAAPVVPADSPVDVEEVVRRARAAYDSLRTLRADFRQVIEMRVFEPPRRREGRGTWYQEKPGLFRMDFEEPEGDLVVSDGEAVWLYYPSTHPGQVVRTSLEGAGAGRSGEIVDLQGRILERALTAYEPAYDGRTSLDGRSVHRVVLEPRGPEADYARVRIWIDARRWLVRKLEFTDRSETVRTIVLDGLEPDVPLPDSLFRFEPPDDVEVFEG